MNDVVLTVSGVVGPDLEERIARGERPRADYLELARACRADLIDYAAARRASGWLGRQIERLCGPNLLLAWACFRQRRRYGIIVTDGEQIGLPLALLLKMAGARRPRHLMITHVISARKKMIFFDLLYAQRQVDYFFVYSSWQKRFIQERWGIAPERVVRTPFMVDARFFAADQVRSSTSIAPTICSVGLERRDYPTLLEAVRDLDVAVTIAAASPWSRRADSSAGRSIPPNVTICRLSQFELRQLYADSRFMVMPLEPVDFQAGVTAILEAMAMGKAVVCTRTPGQTDVIVEGQTGLYVPPHDVQALRSAITYLLDHPNEAARMGQAGRQRVEQALNIDLYAERLGRYARAAPLAASQLAERVGE